jgi:hypothetical protein
MKVKTRPLVSETSYAQQARRAGSIAALCIGAVGCADVLDIPKHPRLASDTAASPPLARTGQAADSEIESASGGEDVTARVGEGPPALPELDGSESSALSALSGSAPEAEPGDAGPPTISLAEFDAGSAPPPSNASPPAVCASGALGPDGSCYAALTTLRTWTASRQRCQSAGAGWDLVSIRSDEVNQFLTERLSRESWIGASVGSVEDSWIWVDDGTEFWRGDNTGTPVNDAYANWDQSQPNGGVFSDCARLVPEASGGWEDRPCITRERAVCAGPPG